MLQLSQTGPSLTACWTLLFILPAFGRQAPTPTDSGPTPGKRPSAIAIDLYGDPLPVGAVGRLGTARWRPGGEIEAMAFSPDGKFLATASKNGTHLWEAATGRGLREFRTVDWWQSRETPAETVAFSFDGQMIGGGEWAPVCWETSTGKLLRQFPAAHGKLYGVAFSPNGKVLAGAWDDQTVQLYDIATGQELHELAAKKPLRSIVFSPNGEFLAAGGIEGELRVWQPATGKELHHLVGQEDTICHLSFSPDGSILASAAWDGTVRLWDMGTGKEVRQLTSHQHMVTLVAFSKDGKTLFSWGADERLRVWNPATGQEIRQLTTPNWEIHLALSPDGSTLAGGGQYRIALLQVATGRPVARTNGNPTPISARFLSDNQTVVSTSERHILRLWQAPSGKLIRQLAFPKRPVRCVAFSSNGKVVASAGFDSYIRLWDIASGKELSSFQTPKDEPIDGLALSPDSKMLASVQGKFVRLWGVATGKELSRLTDLDWGGFSIVFSPDARFLAAATPLQGTVLWAPQTGKSARRFTGEHLVQAVAFSPDGKLLASGDTAGVVRLRDVATGRLLREFKAHTKEILDLAFSPDGQIVASGSADRTVRLSEVASGKELRRFTGHSGPVTSVSIAPGGKLLVSGSEDTTALVWDVSRVEAGNALPAPK
jgi:WD40 repeat protein